MLKIVCVGDNVIDYYKNLGVMYPGGNAVNVACHSAMQNQKAYYAGNIADDQMGEIILDSLKKKNVDVSYARIIDNSSTKYCDYDVVDGERTYLDVVVEDNWAGIISFDELPSYIKEADIVHCSVNAKMPEEVMKWNNLDGVMVYDFGEKEKYRTDEYLSTVGNVTDLGMFSCQKMSIEEISEFMKRIHSFGIRHILITMGTDGQYFSNGLKIFYNPTEKVVPVDTMGAGDSYLSCFMISLRENGFVKNEIFSNEKEITNAMKKAAAYSANNCLVEGAFGIKVTL
ncbi:MAG: PfkB family carbohydrate kinase [Erysipelotrichaceae bacterium]|nr:PfkB family carbohydrate kinase [Erysipelotrichaceae bacterium]